MYVKELISPKVLCQFPILLIKDLSLDPMFGVTNMSEECKRAKWQNKQICKKKKHLC